MGLSPRDIQIGLIAAMVESNLVNVNYGDRDSLGLFQQRPSQGWGSPSQVTNPEYAAGKFFSALKGLGDRRWGMSMGEAAQAVQRSAYPDRYGQRIGDARSLWPRLLGSTGPVLDMDGNPYGAPNPATGELPKDQPLVPEQMMATPDAADMLGAAPGLPDPNRLTSEQIEEMTQINPGTNESVIMPLAQEMGGFEPGVDGWRKGVISTARGFLGTPYVWGGTNPGGFDCSGLVQYVYKQMGINLPRVSFQQATAGKRIGIKDLRPGDLVAWDNSSRNNGADHIAIYIGGGQIIEAPRPGLSVRIRGLGGDEGAWGVRING